MCLKVFWEPFIEPWNFTINVTRKQESSSLLNSSVLTDVHLVSSSHLNLNLTEPFTEVKFHIYVPLLFFYGCLFYRLIEVFPSPACINNALAPLDIVNNIETFQSSNEVTVVLFFFYSPSQTEVM